MPWPALRFPLRRRSAAVAVACALPVTCAVVVALGAQQASAGACGVTAVAITDDSPVKADPARIPQELDMRRGATKNVGQEICVRGRRQAGAPTGAVTYRWFVEGEVIDDYTESPAEITPPGQPETNAVANPFTIADRVEGPEGDKTGAVFTDEPDHLLLAHERDRPLGSGAAVVVRLAVSERHGDDAAPPSAGSTEKTYTVERNKTAAAEAAGGLLRRGQPRRGGYQTEHRQWHIDHMQDHNGNLPYDGSLFPVFHSRLLANYDAFRAAFGWPAKGVYVPPNALPTAENGYTMLHFPANGGTRNTSFTGNVSGMRQPHYTTADGGVVDWANGAQCTPVSNGVRHKQADFPTLSEFGCAVEKPWHNNVHTAIGGDMASSLNAPKDPIFWRWHGYLNSIFRAFPNKPPGKVSAAAAQHGGHGGGGATCQGLEPTIKGTRRDDVLRGTARRDIIVAGAGDDRIAGRGGNDVICAGAGRDRVDGGRGWDLIEGDAGADRLAGGPHGDQMEGGDGDDRVLGGSGTDLLGGGMGDDVVDGGSGNEWMIDGGMGDDRLTGGPGVDELHGHEGRDALDGGGGPDMLDGGPGDDRLDGGRGLDGVEYADAPRGVDVDLASGTATGAGRDRLDDFERVGGSPFGDTITGTDASEEISGGDGNDTIRGGSGQDALDGGDGTDGVSGGSGEDACSGDESGGAARETRWARRPTRFPTACRRPGRGRPPRRRSPS